MRCFFLAAFFCAVACVTNAQAFEPHVNKLIEMGKPQLLQPQLPNVTSGNKFQLGQMPCVVPDTTELSPIPNVLPQLIIPPVFAIPNPGLAIKFRVLKSRYPSRKKNSGLVYYY